MQKHLIKKQVLKLQLPTQEQGFQIQNILSRLNKTRILPILSQVFDRHSNAGLTYIIDKIELDLGSINIVNLEQELLERIEVQFDRAIAELLGTLNKPALDDTQRLLQLLSHFMETGALPWWAADKPFDLENCVTLLLYKAPSALLTMLATLLKKEQCLNRLIWQCSNKILLEINNLLSSKNHLYLNKWHGKIFLSLKRLSLPYYFSIAELRTTYWQIVITNALLLQKNSISEVEFFKQLLMQLAQVLYLEYNVLILALSQLKLPQKASEQDWRKLLQQIAERPNKDDDKNQKNDVNIDIRDPLIFENSNNINKLETKEIDSKPFVNQPVTENEGISENIDSNLLLDKIKAQLQRLINSEISDKLKQKASDFLKIISKLNSETDLVELVNYLNDFKQLVAKYATQWPVRTIETVADLPYRLQISLQNILAELLALSDLTDILKIDIQAIQAKLTVDNNESIFALIDKFKDLTDKMPLLAAQNYSSKLTKIYKKLSKFQHELIRLAGENDLNNSHEQLYNLSLVLDRVLKKLIGNTSLDKVKQAKEYQELREGIYIGNAGLLLLWIFLKPFFTAVKLLQDNQFINQAAAKRAALLLQYLIDPQLEFSEAELPLNKILCGIELSEPLEKQLDITVHEQAECDKLFQAVIAHWPVIGRVSKHYWKEQFLLRNAVIRDRDAHWLIQVERSTHDILMDSRSWPISVIRLPWLEKYISVEW